MNELDSILPVLRQNAARLLVRGILCVRPGYKLTNGWPTKEKAIIAIKAQSAGDVALPAEVGGIPIEVRTATSIEEMSYRHPDQFAALASQRSELRGGAFDELLAFAPSAALAIPADALAAAKPQIPYTPAPVPLSPITGSLTFTCHASPDAGWPTLQSFLQGVHSTLTVAMYDFTSKHILNEISKDVAAARTMEIVLDSPALNPTADQSDKDTVQALSQDLGNRFSSAWALVRANAAIQNWIYPTAYHIKVAVRDSAAVWISSGNWNNSNQPDFDPISQPGPNDQSQARKSDRDWHVIIEDANLANTFETYIKHDFSVASTQAMASGPLGLVFGPVVPDNFRELATGTFNFYPPLRLVNEQATIRPLLTPDPGVYQQAMLSLLQSATAKLYIQLQYIHPPASGTDMEFQSLIDAVVQKINGNIVDVKIILSQWQASNGWLERLQAAGVDLRVVKIQTGVHNKGFVIDSAIVALGSQNWSGDGVLRNRDASVIIENAKAAAYYESIFLDDWNNIARQSVF